MLWGGVDSQLITKLGALFCGTLLAVLVLQMLLYPVRADTKRESLGWEIVISLLSLFCLIPEVLDLVGIATLLGLIVTLGGILLIPVLVLTLGVGLVVFARQANARNGSEFRISLGEVLAMVLTSATLPLLLATGGVCEVEYGYILALLIMPFVYWRGYARLRANCVPDCMERLLFLICYPFMILGTLYLCVNLFAWTGAVQFEIAPYRRVLLVIFCIIVIAGSLLANRLGNILSDRRAANTSGV